MGLACALADFGGGVRFFLCQRVFSAAGFWALAGRGSGPGRLRPGAGPVPGHRHGSGWVHWHGEHCGGGHSPHRRGPWGPLLDVGLRWPWHDDRVRRKLPVGPLPPGLWLPRRRAPVLHRKGREIWRGSGRCLCPGLLPVLPGHGRHGPDQRPGFRLRGAGRAPVGHGPGGGWAHLFCGPGRAANRRKGGGKAGARHEPAVFRLIPGGNLGLSGQPARGPAKRLPRGLFPAGRAGGRCGDAFGYAGRGVPGGVYQ